MLYNSSKITCTLTSLIRGVLTRVTRPRFCLSLLALVLATGLPSSTAQTLTLNTSAYNSIPNQTDSTPFITATGTRVRPGVLAVSRDLLGPGGFPYGSRVKVVSQKGCGINMVGRVYIVEDTMARRKVWSADIWMSSRTTALKFGRCQVTFRKL